ncbi:MULTISPECIES: exodeoxyribonuclease VII large subunit [Pediococcus]|jgi:exodeoxyribonuclease VII large subunit|uniref:Exodeoxyribonuclease 7 large subunit n=3 Tax=Pediococcus pentosaceus TaxID=1255 RepID=EX7L_PEDPA|nr:MULTISPECIES: exodeoxyribonuclease VII large subunit [Pediococcus]Q03FZ4.1 RecName: Full=Exodeoxyribonuclease 7 large subunit; AltName: Full=Exodeoxyribonuclease VII large subunit; Short=Exonuclease VII large subunit [Pediococcus pentosaceus ATCC 25745]ABJ67878.1 Exodeoxyribonuclease VII large subunit [Pediococcus pentosaceus ATCC 25745]AHA04945.1 exodeoxyribonuclease VII large subunit [Pediococcus pentosaceus SL4]ANI98025.1 exodeoxyribonuclease VII large subunit [Pediococcus pentosaceus]AS
MQEDKYLTVSALTNYIKRKFDADPYLHRVYLVGEISNFRLRTNSHQYFSLKDENAKISAIMFKSAFAKVKFQPEEGMRVIVSGRISLYPGNGSYQIYVDSMQPDGVGALYQAYEQLKIKLSQEGLFEAPKLPIPKYPRKIAIVTSPSGAVIRDIITTVSRRYPIVQLVLFPALVQGNEAANSIAAQIKMINTLDDFDTIIIGRGGGSIEDLWPFNEEVVARAIFASKLPVISSVGHETDTTIADLVADMRAATPTAAAELATPVLTDILEELQKLQLQTIVAFRNILKMRSQQVQHLQQSYIFQEPQRLYEGYVQNVDILTEKLISLEKQQITTAEGSFKTLNSRLLANTPASRIKMAKQNVEHLRQMTNNNITNRFSKYANDLNSLIGSLDTLSPLKIMSRGYTYVTRDTKVVKSIEDLSIDDKIQLNFSDGSANAVIKTINSEDK